MPLLHITIIIKMITIALISSVVLLSHATTLDKASAFTP